MLWWEARIKLDPEDYDRFTPHLERTWGTISRGGASQGHGVQWDTERHEVTLSAEDRWDVMTQVRWLMGVAESAQVHLEQRCYRTRDVPASPWAPACECPPDTHPGQTAQNEPAQPTAFGCKMPDWAG